MKSRSKAFRISEDIWQMTGYRKVVLTVPSIGTVILVEDCSVKTLSLHHLTTRTVLRSGLLAYHLLRENASLHVVWFETDR